MGCCEQLSSHYSKDYDNKGKKVDKTNNRYTSVDCDKCTQNSRAKNILDYGLDVKEYIRISTSDKAKQIRNKVVGTYAVG